MIEFDPDKDEANTIKHGISLARAADMTIEGVRPDPHLYESRVRAYGRIDGEKYCLIYVERGGRVRAISLRRSHAKEYDRHVPKH